MRGARDIFEAELRKRKIAFSGPDEEGMFRLETHGVEMTVSLENIARNYNRDRSPESVVRFVDRVLKVPEMPPWKDARSLLYFSAERSDHEFGDAIHERVSESVCKVLVVTDLEAGTVTWVSPGDLKEWGASRRDAMAVAATNLARLLEAKRPEVQDIDGAKLGMIPVEGVFKASVIFAPNFKSFVSGAVGWPVLVVIPCRDFIYVLAEKDKALLDRMGGVVQKEFRNSGYPITTEVLQISDKGIEAVGKFPE